MSIAGSRSRDTPLPLNKEDGGNAGFYRDYIAAM